MIKTLNISSASAYDFGNLGLIYNLSYTTLFIATWWLRGKNVTGWWAIDYHQSNKIFLCMYLSMGSQVPAFTYSNDFLIDCSLLPINQWCNVLSQSASCKENSAVITCKDYEAKLKVRKNLILEKDIRHRITTTKTTTLIFKIFLS